MQILILNIERLMNQIFESSIVVSDFRQKFKNPMALYLCIELLQLKQFRQSVSVQEILLINAIKMNQIPLCLHLTS